MCGLKVPAQPVSIVKPAVHNIFLGLDTRIFLPLMCSWTQISLAESSQTAIIHSAQPNG